MLLSLHPLDSNRNQQLGTEEGGWRVILGMADEDGGDNMMAMTNDDC